MNNQPMQPSIYSQVIFNDVEGSRFYDLLWSAYTLLGPQIAVKIRGMFQDKKGELCFLQNGLHEVDLVARTHNPTKKYIPAKVDGETEWLQLPETIDEVMFYIKPQQSIIIDAASPVLGRP